MNRTVSVRAVYCKGCTGHFSSLCSYLLQEGNTPLFIAARRRPSDRAAISDIVMAVKLLLERGADRSIKNQVSVSYAVLSYIIYNSYAPMEGWRCVYIMMLSNISLWYLCLVERRNCVWCCQRRGSEGIAYAADRAIVLHAPVLFAFLSNSEEWRGYSDNK